jgi:hypothetical protein
MNTEGLPSRGEIRRALAECMTLANIDEAMDWEPGTARRRRWRAPDHGGLPFADAELGGVSIWFRSTIEDWQGALAGKSAQPTDIGNEESPTTAGSPIEAPPEPQPLPAEAGTTTPDEADLADECSSAVPPTGDTPEEADAGPDEDEQAESGAASGAGDDVGHRVLQSGFELDIGQQVVANIHGQWCDAVVTHRDRATVAVDYNIDGTSLGARRQRISLDRVRLPGEE